MRKLIFTACFGLTASMLFAQADEAKLRAAMKQIGPTCSGLGKKITAKDASATADAKTLQAMFTGDVQKFWKAKKATDAVAFAKTASAEFKTISKLTAAGKWDDAQASFKKATATCGGCHGAHREKSASGFTIK